VSHSISKAREIAYDALVQVIEHGKDPDEATEALCVDVKGLKRLDRNFIKEILFGSLRWYSKILWILQNTSKRDLGKSTPEIRAALICGTYQIFYMDRVPDRAAVNESAEYVRSKGQAQAVSFVNGILRQIARRAEYFAKPDKTAKPIEYLSLQFAHPDWIVKRWHTHFKFDRMETILAANNQPPPWTIRINLLKTTTEDIKDLQQVLLREERTHSDRRPLRSALVLKEPPNLGEESLFQKGYYTIQDESSQLIAHLADPKETESIIDAAAGPGGKLSHIYELGNGKTNLVAVERNADQMRKAKETLTRLQHTNLTWVESDFLDYKPKNLVDKVLLDAPCSGLGVLRRHPEGKWQKTATLITEMANLQRKLIEHALTLIKPGGELIFSVCSFEPEETIGQVKWIQDKYGDRIELLSPVSRLPDYYKRYVTRDNILLIYSGNQDEIDGFGAFIIKLKA
jgi:16S rRNA (cytosine967-C5)-methyltransferase